IFYPLIRLRIIRGRKAVTNLKDLCKTINNFVHEMRTIVRLDRLRNTETTNNIVIDKIGCICCSSSLARANFRPPSKRFDYNINILKTELVNQKRTSEVDSPVSEYVEEGTKERVPPEYFCDR